MHIDFDWRESKLLQKETLFIFVSPHVHKSFKGQAANPNSFIRTQKKLQIVIVPWSAPFQSVRQISKIKLNQTFFPLETRVSKSGIGYSITRRFSSNRVLGYPTKLLDTRTRVNYWNFTRFSHNFRKVFTWKILISKYFLINIHWKTIFFNVIIRSSIFNNRCLTLTVLRLSFKKIMSFLKHILIKSLGNSQIPTFLFRPVFKSELKKFDFTENFSNFG